MKSYFLTDVGRMRDHNEDSLTIVKNQEGSYLMAVADGMGGHLAGEVASAIVINELTYKFKNEFKEEDKLGAINWLRNVTKKINFDIFAYADKNPESKGMGTTLVCALITKNYILVGNIGDSSCWVLKNEELHKITHDHTLVDLLVRAGELTEEEALEYPKKNVVMKALGANNPIEIDIFDCDLNIDGILLCSDGLTNMLNPNVITSTLIQKDTIEERVIKLIKKANNRGGTDNISVAYMEFTKDKE